MIRLDKDVIDITSQLIAIRSVTKNEKKLCDEIEESLIDLGFDDYKRDNNSVVFFLKNKNEKTLALAGHIDTVPSADEKQLTPKIVDNELFGLGAVDMKAGVACMLKLAYEIKKGMVEPKYDMMFIFYEGEEGPLPNGMTSLINSGILTYIDFAYVLEPTDARYEIGCLGGIGAKIEITGKEAHSASPWLGENAITKALPILDKISKLKDKKSNIDGIEFVETMNVTQANTKNAANVIPSSFILNLNCRFSPMKSVDEMKKELLELFQGHKIEFSSVYPGCYADVKVSEFLHKDINVSITQAWTDIAQLNAAGIKAINFGPGNIKYAHKADEQININELKEFYKKLKKHII